MSSKVDEIISKYNDLKKELENTSITSDYSKIAKINKELKELKPIYDLYNEKLLILKEIEDNNSILNPDNHEFNEYVKTLNTELSKKLEEIEKKIKIELTPRDKNDDKDIILEIHAGVGGDEAGLFVDDLFKMYSKYIDLKGWKLSIVSSIESPSGGYKEIICNIKGDKVYSYLKYESGVHRVQRIPKTEVKGRIHTSAASVVVMPEVEDVELNLDMNDVRKDTYCSTGAGGQSVNTTYSAVRLTHLPTGMIVTCQDERSQVKNYEKALSTLKARLYKIMQEKQHSEISDMKKSIVKKGDRSDKIRTYNFPQNRITDHRINFTAHNLDKVLQGNLSELINELRIHDNYEEKIKDINEVL